MLHRQELFNNSRGYSSSVMPARSFSSVRHLACGGGGGGGGRFFFVGFCFLFFFFFFFPSQLCLAPPRAAKLFLFHFVYVFYRNV